MAENHKGVLVVISGFSGAGKGTLMKNLLSQYDNYALSVSATTRLPREGETDGVSYFFITKEEFEKRICEGRFLEYARYVENYYGTPRDFVEQMLDSGKDVLLEIEIQGALKVKEQFPEALLIFILPPSAEVLKERLVNRGTETIDVINARMARAVEESKGIENYDYCLVNDDLQTCTEELHGVIQCQHLLNKCRTQANMPLVNSIRKALPDLNN